MQTPLEPDVRRVLHLVSYALYSGPAPSTLVLAQAQREAGLESFVACDLVRGNFSGYEEDIRGHLKDSPLRAPWPFTLSTKSRPLEWLGDFRLLRQLARERAIDVLHVHLSHDHGLAALAHVSRLGLPVVRTIHAARSLELRLGQRWMLSHADALVVRCSAHRRRAIERLGISEARVHLVPGALDLPRHSPATDELRGHARTRFDLPSQVPVVVHVALIAGRGQLELLRACESLGERAPHVVFVGRGEGEAELQAAVEASPVARKIRFAGYLEGPKLRLAYAAADLAFLAQVGNDASARAALEAAGSGLPVLAVATDELVEAVDSTTGYLVPRREVSAIAAGLGDWLADLPGARQKGVAARARMLAERTPALEAARTLEVYREVVRRARAR